MRDDYKQWLIAQEYAPNTQNAQLYRVSKVEDHYGNLDDKFLNGGYDELVKLLSYSTADQKAGKPDPSTFKLSGNIKNSLQSYRDAIIRYRKFLIETDGMPLTTQVGADLVSLVVEPNSNEKQKLSLERDMQAALRQNIAALAADLTIIDDGAERSVETGFIDILCENTAGAVVVIELKAGKTDAKVVGQILGYMGDILGEGETNEVQGIVVAHEFDKRTISAAKAVPNLKLVRYSISFKFEPEMGL
jgi:hypothetical protein